jgi:NADH-quinone oxidoreductase subunit L
VSALLHAATMVAAGVFLVVRADPLFALAPGTREVMLWIGASTAVFAAGLALVQNDIKKVLAYSTVSQLGYMVAALGAGSAFAGFFHLGTHAFFKALLFLAAGSVIHAVHSNQLSDMGGLRKKLPLTTAAFVIGALSLAGFPGFAGFFSKDLVLSSLEGKASWIPWTMLMGAAFLTAFYMGRVLIKAFGGELSEKSAHAHEGGAAMTGPLVILAIPALASGFLGGWLASEVKVAHELHLLALTPVVASSMSLVGLAASYFVFRKGGTAPLAATLEKLDAFSLVDRAWAFGYQAGLLGISAIAGWVDRYLVDGLMNFSGWSALEGGESARRIQTGKVRDYALAVVAGVVVLALIGVLR